MLLVLDIGNTNIAIGVFGGDSEGGDGGLAGHWRFSSLGRTGDEAGLLLENLLNSHDFDKGLIDGAILCSVVPSLEEVWRDAVSRYVGRQPLIVAHDIDLGMRIDIDHPGEVGADRLANAVAASEKFGGPLVAVDLGTAINLDVVSADGAYIGGAIAPGLAVSMETLFSRTAKLPQVALRAPERVIGRNTINAVQSGIVYGYAGLVDALVERMFAELGTRTPVIATGGHAEVLAEHSRTITNIEPWLTLDGLRIIYRRCAGRDA
ncbi:MAG: type III pantothenate kinase [Synergistaceae bacterium]|jgi:type III pantothenate kinase|nr:type III pantothenate kinase [Synergistaceae bacterium]